MGKQKHNYWNDETRISGLKKVIEQIGHFPTHTELCNMGRRDLSGNIVANGGIFKYAQLLGYTIKQRPKDYWIIRGISNSVKEMVDSFGHFPHRTELVSTEWNGLYKYLLKNKELDYYRNLYNYHAYRKPDGYWNDDNIVLEELKKVICSIGYFPTKSKLYDIDRGDLINQIDLHGGFNKYRRLLKYDITKEKNGFWNDSIIVEKLKPIIEKLGFFPARSDLNVIGESRLISAISEFGGLIKFQRLFNISCDYFKSYKSAMASYVVKRGKNTEDIIYDILCSYCESNDLKFPIKNKKLAIGNVIEFVCNTNKRIGIDVTNTESKSIIYRKWTKQHYYKYLDELWIVVVSDSFNGDDYKKWNEESPDNVYVYSIEQFCNELQYNLDESMKNKIYKYKKCTFHTINQYKKEKQEDKLISS